MVDPKKLDPPEDSGLSEDETFEGAAALQPGIPRSIQLAAMTNWLGFTVSDLVQLGQVDQNQIEAWQRPSSDTGLPRLVDDVRAISSRMVQDGRFAPEEIGPWFREPNAHLASQRPLRVIEDGRYEDVLVASRLGPIP